MDTSASSLVQRVYASLSLQMILLVVPLFVAIRFCHQIVYYHFFHPLAKFPGPFWAGVTRLWATYHHLMMQENDVYEKLCKRYGPIVRISPTLLLVSSSSALPIIYHRRADKTGSYVGGLHGDTDTENIFNTKEWTEHARKRKPLAGPFSFSNVKKMEPLIDAQIKHWIHKMGDQLNKEKKFLDFDLWPRFLTFDVLADVAFGAPFGFIKTTTDVNGLIKEFRAGLPLAGVLMRLYPFTQWIRDTWFGKKFMIISPKDKSGWGFLMRFRDQLIDRRRKELKDGTFDGRTDLLQAIFDARHDDGTPLSAETIKAEIFIILLAGVDTTGTALQTIVRFIAATQSVHCKVIAELDQATKEGGLSAIPQFDEVQRQCPYYVACVKESLRLYPSVANPFARVAPPQGLVIEGANIPAGTEVSVNAWITGRDETLFGPDAHVFRPERWLESTEQAALYEKYSFVFGYGARVCLGKDIALMELYKAPLQLFRAYSVELETEGHFAVSAGLGFWENLKIRIAPCASMDSDGSAADREKDGNA